MNSQNILKYYGSKLDLKLDSSEYYDFELTTINDLDYSVFDGGGSFDSLLLNTNLSGFSHVINTISLIEFENSDDPNSVYSGLSLTLDFNLFSSLFNTLDVFYKNVYLNNNIYIYSGDGFNHYFRINNLNQSITYDPYFSGFTVNQILSGFSTNYIECFNGCCDLPDKFNVKPWAYKIYSNNNCQIFDRRNTDGWTLDFVFNRDSFSWINGSIFYYLGVRGDDNKENYLDNNLSFGFTENGEIKWSSIRYSAYCHTESGYTTTDYVMSGKTSPICVTGATSNFNVTIVFKRNRSLFDCDIENDGGWNDLITGKTLVNDPLDVMTGETEEYIYTETLNSKWLKERYNRLGVLKIYLNGKLFYKYDNFEEVVLSNRGVQPYIQSWGGGTPLMNNIHDGVCRFEILKIKYFNTPLNFIDITKNHKINKSQFNIIPCNSCD